MLKSKMLKLGLTGSIAVGKSFVSAVFAELGAAVLDADAVSREVVEPNTAGWRQIVETFGETVLNTDSTLDRAKLGEIVFSDEHKREKLNKIVHPLVFTAQSNWLDKIAHANENAVAIIDAALMIETGNWRNFDKVIVVWCDSQTQIKRLMLRNNLTEPQAVQRIAAQMPQDEKKKYADFMIDSSNGFDDTRLQTAAIYQELLKIA